MRCALPFLLLLLAVRLSSTAAKCSAKPSKKSAKYDSSANEPPRYRRDWRSLPRELVELWMNGDNSRAVGALSRGTGDMPDPFGVVRSW